MEPPARDAWEAFFGIPTAIQCVFLREKTYDMLSVEMNDDVIIKQRRTLEAALSTDKNTERILRNAIRKVIIEARKEIVDSLKNSIAYDPRGTARSVRTSVYKKLLGANVNILSSRKVHTATLYEPPKKLKPGQWGGNRRKRSERTRRVMSYGPLDRGFILRYLNNGTGIRTTVYGNRGSIKARNFFKGASKAAIMQAADNLSEIIDNELENILNKNTQNKNGR